MSGIDYSKWDKFGLSDDDDDEEEDDDVHVGKAKDEDDIGEEDYTLR